jgi:hypothetical protein
MRSTEIDGQISEHNVMPASTLTYVQMSRSDQIVVSANHHLRYLVSNQSLKSRLLFKVDLLAV